MKLRMCNFVAVIDHKLVMQMQIESMWRCDNVSGLGEHVTFLGIALSLPVLAQVYAFRGSHCYHPV